jgi:23S rRNA pseudouridine1911/1915/1917 synthase
VKAVVPPDLDGRRADLVVARLAGVSRAAARRIVEAGGAVVDGRVPGVRDAVRAGSIVEVELAPEEALLVAEQVPFEVRYEDEHLAVVDKPSGVVVHPGAGRPRGTLAAGLLHRWPQIEGVGEPGRWGIVHRLDRETSGLLVVALDHRSLTGLQQAIAARKVQRSYLAVVVGRPEAATGTIDAPLDRDPDRPGRIAVVRGGRPARTHYAVLASWRNGVSLLELRLETGRTHQIRVHLAAIGLPVAGDGRYGRPAEPATRLFLHACRLRFTHPLTGAEIDVTSPLPEDLRAVVESLGAPDSGSVP